jgi:hypothetical protein
MPSVSEKQRRAMQAAAHGNSTIGIPQSVGQEFAAADAAESCPHCGGTGKKATEEDKSPRAIMERLMEDRHDSD